MIILLKIYFFFDCGDATQIRAGNPCCTIILLFQNEDENEAETDLMLDQIEADEVSCVLYSKLFLYDFAVKIDIFQFII